MHNTVLMYILNSRDDLLHELNRLFLIQPFSLNDIVEKFSSLSILHDQVNICFGLNDLCEVENTSYSWITLGCLSIFRMHIYRVTRSMSACSTIFSFLKKWSTFRHCLKSSLAAEESTTKLPIFLINASITDTWFDSETFYCRPSISKSHR